MNIKKNEKKYKKKEGFMGLPILFKDVVIKQRKGGVKGERSSLYLKNFSQFCNLFFGQFFRKNNTKRND
jgi:hypothetical protein